MYQTKILSSDMGDIKAWLESIGPSPKWIDASDPTKADPAEDTKADDSTDDVTITIPGWLIAKAKSWLSTVLTRFGCVSSPVPDAPDAPGTETHPN